MSHNRFFYTKPWFGGDPHHTAPCVPSLPSHLWAFALLVSNSRACATSPGKPSSIPALFLGRAPCLTLTPFSFFFLCTVLRSRDRPVLAEGTDASEIVPEMRVQPQAEARATEAEAVMA